MTSVIVLFIVFVLIAVRKIGNIRLQIWQIMLLGAAIVLVTGRISPADAVNAVNIDVMLFLFGMFIIGEALEQSGFLSRIAYRVFGRTKSIDVLVIRVLFGAGLMSAFLMNDTIAIIGTPVVLMLARRRGIPSSLMLLALAFGVTIGSVMSPIGNPQNLLIAVNGSVPDPFITFFKFLLLPTLLNLFLAYLLLKMFYREHFNRPVLYQYPKPLADVKLARLCQASLALVAVLIAAKIVLIFWHIDFRLTYIALVGMLPVVVFGENRARILKNIDWQTLVFFAAMFVLMRSVWDSGFFQELLRQSNVDLSSVSVIMGVSIVLSQLISNVPMVALYLPMLTQLGTSSREMMALAAGSTIAGNLSILGAASNVIIIQNAERKSADTLSFLEYARIGLPLTLINLAVYGLFLHIM